MRKTHKIPGRIALFGRSAFLGLAAITIALVSVTTTYADSYDDQIRALQSQVDQFQAAAGQLKAQADTLQNQINILQDQANALQSQIDLNTARLAQLNQQITDTQQKLASEKIILGNNLVTIYLDQAVSPLEMLASSKSIADFIDKQEAHNTIRSQLQDSITTVQKLQNDLNTQKNAVEQTLADQNQQRSDLAGKQQEQSNLLAQTQGQEAAYQQLTNQKNSEIVNLRAQQAAANTKWGGNVNYQAAGGGYPAMWANAPLDAYVDDWGMYTRECVSFAAFKVAQSGRYMPYGLGNAIQWPGGARARGIPVDSSPKAGDVAIWPVGYYGHAMYVYSVAGDGSIYIGEYNYDWTGRYSERSISSGTWHAQGFQFIHF